MKKTFYKLLTAASLMMGLQANAQNISTLAGTGTAGYSGDGGPATAANVQAPWGITTDPAGNVYFVDLVNNVLRKVDVAGNISTLAGTGFGGYSGDGGPATAAEFNTLAGVALDKSGNIYLADANNRRIRKIDAAGTIATIAGTGFLGSVGDGGAATAASFNGPSAIALDNAGNIYVCDRFNNKVRKIDLSGNISTIAGDGTAGYIGDGGAATAAEMNNPIGIAVDQVNNVYVADLGNNRVRMITPAGIMSTVAGAGTGGTSTDGMPATSGPLVGPFGVSVDAAGNLFIAEANGNSIRVVNTSGIINTVAGNHFAPGGYSGDGGAATAAILYNDKAVTVDGNGNVYISDAGNNVIRKITALSFSVTGSATVCTGSNITLSTSGSNGVWSSSNTGIATVSSAGLVTGIAAGTATISYNAILGSGTSVISVNTTPTAGTISGTDNTCIGGTSALANATTGGIWSSSDGGVATISGSGVVSGVTAGVVTITYIVSTSCGTATATYPFTVNTCPTEVTNVADNTASLVVYPNPATAGQLTIKMSGDKGTTVRYTLTNITGAIIYETTAALNTEVKVHANFAKGVYFLSAIDANETKQAKIVIQ